MVFTLLSWNCNRLKSKQHVLLRTLRLLSVDVCCVQETWLTSDDDYHPSGFHVIRRDRDSRGGGLAILVRHDIPFLYDPNLQAPCTDGLETLRVDILLGSETFTVVTAYHPSGLFSSNNLVAATQSLHPLILTGDFNCHHRAFGSYKTTLNGENLYQWYVQSNLSFLNTGSVTHLHHDGAHCVLDLAFISDSFLPFTQWNVQDDSWGSDHLPHLIRVANNGIHLPRPRTFTNWRMCSDLINSDPIWQQEDFTAGELSAIFCNAHRRSGIRRVLSHQEVYWWSHDCRIATRNKRKALYRARRTLNPADWLLYKEYAAIQKRVMLTAKRTAWLHLVHRLSESKTLYSAFRILKKRLRPSVTADKVLKINNILTFDTLQQSEAFASFFTNIEQVTIPAQHFDHFMPNEDLDHPFSFLEFQSALRRFRSSSPGVDGITSDMVKTLHVANQEKLLGFLNSLWRSGQVPSSWKHAIILPILKPGKDPTVISSYRPISLTSVLGKLMEKMILRRILWLSQSLHLFPSNQFGFISGRSALDCHITILKEITRRRLLRHTIFFTVLDIQKAYDSVNIQRLLNKLESLPWIGNGRMWIQNFLRNRTAQVKWGHILSSTFPVTRGMPQGAVLSAFLYVIYTAGAGNLNFPYSELFMFVDDLYVLTSHASEQTTLTAHQQALTQVEQWFNENDLQFLAAKCSSLNFSNTRNHNWNPLLTLHSQSIPWCRQVKILGLIYTDRLSWTAHLGYLAQKGTKFNNLLKLLRTMYGGASTSALLRLIRSHLFPMLDYCSPAFSGSCDSSFRTLRTSYHSALRIASGLPKATPIEVLLAECNMPALIDRFHLLALRYTAKCRSKSDGTPGPLSLHLPPADSVSPRLERSDPHRYLHNLWENFVTADISFMETDTFVEYWIPDPKISFHLRSLPFQRPHLESVMIQHLFHDYSNSIPATSVFIATDGSKSNTGTGFGYVCPAKGCARSFSLSPHASTYTAEGFAILAAIEEVCVQAEDYIIMSDSYSNLSALHSVNSKSSSITIRLAQALLKHSSRIKSLTFVWTPSHVGIPLNEEADNLAHRGSAGAPRFTECLPLEDCLNFIRRTVVDSRIFRWLSTPYAARFPYLGPLNYWLRSVTTSRQFEVLISRLRTNTAPLAQFLHRIGQSSSPDCPVCQVPESAQHFVFDCIIYCPQRLRLRLLLHSLRITDSFVGFLHTLSHHSEAVRELERFLRDTDRLIH